jgi:hypothetical protein
LGQLESSDIEVTNQVAIVINTLASEGTLTIRPILLAGAPARLLDQVRQLVQSTSSQAPKVLSSVMRALRNVLVSTADLVWGHAYGVEMEKKVVGTGLVGMVMDNGKGKAAPGRESLLENEAIKALDSVFDVSLGLIHWLIFKPSNLDIVLPLLESRSHQQSAFLLYQIYSRLIVLPSHSETLARWRPPAPPSGPSGGYNSPSDVPYILVHLVNTISHERNSKTLEAALDLLAVLVKGHRGLASKIKKVDIGRHASSDRNLSSPNAFMELLEGLLETAQSSVRISVAAW